MRPCQTGLSTVSTNQLLPRRALASSLNSFSGISESERFITEDYQSRELKGSRCTISRIAPEATVRMSTNWKATWIVFLIYSFCRRRLLPDFDG